MYLFRMPTPGGDEVAFDVVGSSPEALVTLKEGRRCCTPSPARVPRRG